MTITSPNPMDKSYDAIELLPLSERLYRSDSDFGPNITFTAVYGDGRQTFENEEAKEALLTPRSQYPRLPQNAFIAPVERTYYALAKWVIGPQPPRIYKIQPVFRHLQSTPIRLLHRNSTKWIRFWLLICLYTMWASAFLVILGSVHLCQAKGYRSAVRLSCVSRFW